MGFFEIFLGLISTWIGAKHRGMGSTHTLFLLGPFLILTFLPLDPKLIIKYKNDPFVIWSKLNHNNNNETNFNNKYINFKQEYLHYLWNSFFEIHVKNIQVKIDHSISWSLTLGSGTCFSFFKNNLVLRWWLSNLILRIEVESSWKILVFVN